MLGTAATTIASSSEPDDMTVDWALLASSPNAALSNSRANEPDVFLSFASRSRAMDLPVQIATKEGASPVLRRL